MTDEERLALAAKLDADLDVFIDSLEKKRYTEGWPEDRWEQVRVNKLKFNSHVTFVFLISGNGKTSLFHENCT